MVITNNSSESKTFGTARFGESLKNCTSGTDVVSGKSVNVKNDITVEAKSVLILELK